MFLPIGNNIIVGVYIMIVINTCIHVYVIWPDWTDCMEQSYH